MRVTNLSEGHNIYTSNAYLVTGDYNKSGDINAMIDVGRDPIIIENLLKIFAPQARINTIGFWPQYDDRKLLEAIANQSSGELVLITD